MERMGPIPNPYPQGNNGKLNRPRCPIRPNPPQFPIAMAYVPWQQFGDLLPPEQALLQGTIFQELNLVFCGKRGGCV